jgi:hypothetical protein
LDAEKVETTVRSEIKPMELEPEGYLIDLEALNEVFTFAHGFHRPDWELIAHKIESTVATEKQPQAWNDAWIQWLQKLKKDFGGQYEIYESCNFTILSTTSTKVSDQLLKLAERVLALARVGLEDVITDGLQYHRVILAISDDDDYYEYISYFFPDGQHPVSAGVNLNQGGPHTVLNLSYEYQVPQTLCHELMHAFLENLPLPLWVNEGLAVSAERVASDCKMSFQETDDVSFWGSRTQVAKPVVTADQVAEHQAFWNEENIQEFWAGVSFQRPGLSCELSYSLAEVMVNLLAENKVGFRTFIAQAHHIDAGQTSAWNCLNVCLGDAMAKFLGPGNWKPVRKSMVDAMDKHQNEMTNSKPQL